MPFFFFLFAAPPSVLFFTNALNYSPKSRLVVMMTIPRLESEGGGAKRIKLNSAVDIFADDNVFYLPRLIACHHHDLQSTPNPNFDLKVIPQELLATEIFPRLADSLTAIRCSAVCKQWNSLVTAPEFVPNFLHHHPSAYAMFVAFTLPEKSTVLCPVSLMVDGSSVTAASVSTEYNFTLHDLPLALESACDDFLLLSRISTGATWDRVRCLYIHNPITRQLLPLPRPPLRDQCGFSAIVSHRDSTPSRYNFRVVYLTRSEFGTPAQFHATVFSPETGRWSAPTPAYNIPEKLDPVACNGLLYFVDCANNRRVVIFDAFAESWSFVEFPPDLVLPLFHRLQPPQHGIAFGPVRKQYLASVGVVQGRVRLVQLVRVFGVFVLKVWELSCDNSLWGPVREVRIKNPPLKNTEWVYFLSFHPEDSEMVFLCRDYDVCSYRLSTGKYTRVFTLSWPKGDGDPIHRRWLPGFAHVLTVRLPPWPTAMPALPSSLV